jgi:serine/threonine protein kinase
MGEVYKAKDTRLDRTVAIKVLPSHLAESPERRERFEREARAVSSLNHPNICTLHDIGEQEGTHYLVMEYIEGETLADKLQKGPLPLDQALRYGIQIADALDKAHRQGVVHRDLKPGNVMITKPGAKLLDFGLAKFKATGSGEDAVDLSALPTEQKPLTKEGSILGTFQYMAPEQLEGKEADARTDIFAFGSLLYEMVTGKRAFEGQSQASLISAIMSSEPRPISELQPMSPTILDRIARRCLEKDPDERWQTAKDLAAELAWVRERDSGAGVPDTGSRSPRSRERWAWGVAVVATIAALALAAKWIDRAPANESVTQFVINPPDEAAFSHFGLRSPVVSPDGLHVAFNARDSAGERIWVRSLDSLQTRPLAGTDNALGFFWSTDSRSIGFYGDGALRKVDVSGGPPQTIVEHRAASWGGAWNNEGVILFAPLWSPIHQVRSGGETSDPLTSLDASRGELAHWPPQFLPDGEHFLFYVLTREAEHRGTYVSSLDTPEDKRLILQGANAVYAFPGYLLFAREGNLLAQRFDVDRLESVGESIAVGKQVAVFYSHGLFSASTNGVLAYRRPYTPDYQLAWFDRRGNQLGILPLPGGAQNPEFSPDGKQIAFELWDPETGARDVWLFELSRGIASRFTFDPSNDSDPVWSPDGSHIAFSSGRDGYQSLYQKDADGSVEVEMIHQAEDEEWPVSWSPDGQHILYNRWSSDRSGVLFLLPLSGDRQPAPMFGSEFEELQAQFSPDGRWVSYTSDESGRREVYVQPFPLTGAKFQISTEGGTDGRWRGDGKEMFYLAPGRTLMAVPLSWSGKTLLPSTPQVLFTAPTSGLPIGVGMRFLYAASHDGERFLIQTDGWKSSAADMVVVLNWTAELEE